MKFDDNCMNILFVAVAIFVLYYIMQHYQMKDTFEGLTTQKAVLAAPTAVHRKPEQVINKVEAAKLAAPAGVVPQSGLGQNEVFASVDQKPDLYGLTEGQVPADCYPKDELEPDDLLPRNAATQFAQENPSAGVIGDQNFLDAGYHIGVNTVGQTLRNANRQVRSEPPNPQVKVSPWLQATIGPDTNLSLIHI